jgi:hypothetical protein
MTAETVMITNAPVSNDNERIRFSIVQRRREGPSLRDPLDGLVRSVMSGFAMLYLNDVYHVHLIERRVRRDQ